MKDIEVIQCFENAWKAMAKMYAQYQPSENIRCAMNIIARIIGQVKNEVEESHITSEARQIDVWEWIEWLKQEVE